jgi:hypothetical protein
VTVYIGGKQVGPPEPQRPDRDTIQHWIERITDEGRNLTVWEIDFIESVTNQWQSLTNKQIEILERIYTEKVP